MPAQVAPRGRLGVPKLRRGLAALSLVSSQPSSAPDAAARYAWANRSGADDVYSAARASDDDTAAAVRCVEEDERNFLHLRGGYSKRFSRPDPHAPRRRLSRCIEKDASDLLCTPAAVTRRGFSPATPSATRETTNCPPHL